VIGRTEFDPLGSNLTVFAPEEPPPGEGAGDIGATHIAGLISQRWSDFFNLDGGCLLDGTATSCNLAMGAVNSGAATIQPLQRCIGAGCGGSKIKPDKETDPHKPEGSPNALSAFGMGFSYGWGLSAGISHGTTQPPSIGSFSVTVVGEIQEIVGGYLVDGQFLSGYIRLLTRESQNPPGDPTFGLGPPPPAPKLIHCDPKVKAAIEEIGRLSTFSQMGGATGFEYGFAVKSNGDGTFTPGPIVTSRDGMEVNIPITIGETIAIIHTHQTNGGDPSGQDRKNANGQPKGLNGYKTVSYVLYHSRLRSYDGRHPTNVDGSLRVIDAKCP